MKISYKKLTQKSSPIKIKSFYDRVLPGKTLNQYKLILKKLKSKLPQVLC